MNPKRLLAPTAAVLTLLFGRVASAQQAPTAGGDSPEFIKDRRLGDGIGVRTGDVELHWSLAGEVGYDSNYFLRSNMNGVANGPPTAPVIPSLEFRLSPSISLATLNPQSRGESDAPPPFTFRVGAFATYRDFISLSSNSTASQPQNDISSNRNVSGGANARVDILPGRPWGANAMVTYVRTIQPNAIAANPDLSFNTDTVAGTGELVAQPGSGTLDWRLGGGYTATIFEESQASGFTNGIAQVYTRGRWTFRPRSALLYHGSLTFQNYNNSGEALQQGLVSSTPVRSTLGINTLLTDRFALLALAGWAASFYDSTNPRQPQFDSVIGQAELKWFLAASPGIEQASDVTQTLSSVSVGFTRDFAPSYFANFYTSDRGYLAFHFFVASRLALTLQGGVGSVQYPNMFWGDGVERHPGFTDARADATLFGEYHLLENFGINATLRYTQNISDTHNVPVTENPAATVGPNFYDMAWTRFEAYLGVRWFM